MNVYLSQILHIKYYSLVFAWWAVRSQIHGNILNIYSDKPSDFDIYRILS